MIEVECFVSNFRPTNPARQNDPGACPESAMSTEAEQAAAFNEGSEAATARPVHAPGLLTPVAPDHGARSDRQGRKRARTTRTMDLEGQIDGRRGRCDAQRGQPGA